MEYFDCSQRRGVPHQTVGWDGGAPQCGQPFAIPDVISGKERRVRLQGEAWFEVAKSAEIPFYVMAEDLEIRVYGTSFNVNTHGMRAVQTVLTEGEVGVRSLRSGKEVRMVPGQLAEYGRSDRELRIREVNVRQYTAWKEGYFYFDDRSLEEMMDELARWYDMEIVYQSNHENASFFRLCATL